MKPVIQSIAILILPLFFLSCNNKQMETKKELVIGVSQDYRATDVFSHKGFNCFVFETLVKMDTKGTIRPFLAESWKKSADGRHYTFYLRKDVRFSDGTPLTADQVKDAMFYKQTRKRKRGPARGIQAKRPSEGYNGKEESALKNSNPGKNSSPGIDNNYSTFDNERYNLPRWSSFSSIDIIDEHTIRFNLPRPYTLFLSELATTHSYPVLKPAASEEVTGYIGTGPYKIDVHKRTQYMILVKNDQYWQGSVNIERIRLKVIPDAETRAIALEAGEIDITGYDHFDKIPNESVTRLKYLPSITVTTMGNVEQPSVSFIAINDKKDPFQNPAVRKALAMAIDVKQIETLISETGSVIAGPFPQKHELCNPAVNRPLFDKTAAKQLLSEAGWTDHDQDGILEKDGNPLAMTLTFSFFDPQYKIIAEMVQAQLRNIGVQVRLNMVELGTHITVMRNGEYDLAFWPLMRYHMFFYTGHPSWLNVYSNPELDASFLQYLHGNSEKERKNAVYKTQELIQKSYVFPVFFERFDVIAWNHDVLKDFEPLPVGWDLSMYLWKSRLM
ncbi:ABC transporter substrate-binding protein [Desulfobacula phenolica]|uniref:ABC-type transport system, substrate-binding protein n=1 Tax=Desulfobacula phenolica TaxID=90732 RepID=A0A1H2ICD9_9BACT|nr:ABC transporter substrate-binding protein [Desulfobacula phenolica]SDU41606.1 ABC-type transport system, substrate-binding protein [Desulfobacula phenolica]